MLHTIAFSGVKDPYYRTIKIGVIAASPTALETLLPLYKQIVEPDINAYVAKLPSIRFIPPIKFEFLIEDAQYSADVHLQKVQKFHAMGVDLIIGGGWSAQAAGSLDYINEHGMLLISFSSTAPSLAIPDDNLFRLVPDDLGQAYAIAAMLLSKGVTKVIVLQRDDIWADGIYNAFAAEYDGTILTRQQYPEDCTDFTTYLNAAEEAAAGTSDEGVLILSFEETATLITQAQNYPKIYSFEGRWFGSDSEVGSAVIVENAPMQADHLKIYSTLGAVTPETVGSVKYKEMAKRYEDLVGQTFTIYTACEVDAGWLLALGVLETQSSTAPKVTATNIIKVLPDIASRYYGYSGWCLLNERGDRMPSCYDIWGYGLVDGEVRPLIYGSYTDYTGVTWYDPPHFPHFP